MKVTYVTNVINCTTGLERMITVQTDYFIKYYGYHIDLVLLKQNEDEKTSFFELNENIKLHFLKNSHKGLKQIYSSVKALNKTLEKIKPEVVVVCVDDVFGLYLPKFLSKKHKIVYQRHSTKNVNVNQLSSSTKVKVVNAIKKKLISYGGKGYDKFVLLTEDHKNDWPHLQNHEVICNPLIIETKDLQSTLDNKTVLAVGRHDPIKGFDKLLFTWSKVVKKHSDWKLKILGKKTTSLDLTKVADKLKVSDSVIFQDYTKDMTKAYMDASILACSSSLEGFPLTLIEAMSFGVPVVSFDCPYGPRAIITNNEDGILVEPNDSKSFARSLDYLMENDELRREFGNKSKMNIQRFAPEYIMPKWKTLFESLT